MVASRTYKPSIVEEAVTARLVNVMVPVAVKFATERSPEMMASPWTPNALAGVEVPTPTAPVTCDTTSRFVATANPPATVEVDWFVTARFVRVVVPKVAKMLSPVTAPPVIVNPLEEASPPAAMPPVKVEVAAEVLSTPPPVMVKPLVRARLVPEMPPAKVEVAVPWLSNAPEEIVKPFDEARPYALMPPAKVEVPAAFEVKEVETTSAEVEAMEETVRTVAVAFVVVRFVMVELAVFAKRRPVTTKSVVVA